VIVVYIAIAAILRTQIKGRLLRQATLDKHIIKLGTIILVKKDIVMNKLIAAPRGSPGPCYRRQGTILGGHGKPSVAYALA